MAMGKGGGGRSEAFSSMKSPASSENRLNPRLDYFNYSNPWVKIDGSCLNPDKKILTPNKIINLYITYDIKL